MQQIRYLNHFHDVHAFFIGPVTVLQMDSAEFPNVVIMINWV